LLRHSQHDAAARTNGKETVHLEHTNTVVQVLQGPFVRHPLTAFNLNTSYK